MKPTGTGASRGRDRTPAGTANSTPGVEEKRREPRRPADGPVKVTLPGAKPVEVRGRLVDVSNSGFRMSYATGALQSGQLVDFEHPEASGVARVIWNRILEGRIESGFLVIERRDAAAS